ncbi:MAG: DUF2752 domain-containing protein [Planctomycetes bacterium]|nr:DUF2752 domain-containing protein [Planctomycetota bacterium]
MPAIAFPTVSALRGHLPTLILSGIVIALAILFQVTPDGQGVTAFGRQLPESCLVRRTTGRGCPGCGLTRSFVTGVRLDPAAFQFHPLGPFLLLIVIAQLPYRTYRLWQNETIQRPSRPSAWPLYLLCVLGLALILTWGARMAGVLP